MRICFFTTICLISLHAGAQQFPNDFAAHWKGELKWYRDASAEPRVVPMQLIIQPADSGCYSWQLIYGDRSDDNRPYLLKPVDSAAGHWIIDERNGIILDQYWKGGRLTGAFTVQNSTIVNTYYLQDSTLVAEFYAMGSKAVNTTGGGSEEIPPVDSYSINSFQRAVLKKKTD